MPPALVGAPWDTILADESQQFVPSGADDSIFVPSCESPGTSAQPSPRYVELAKVLEEQGGHAVLGSICEADYASYFDAILGELGSFLEADRCE